MAESVTTAMADAGRKEAERHKIFGPRRDKWVNERAWASIYWAMEKAKNERRD